MVVKRTLKSYLKGSRVYAYSGDAVSILWTSGHVVCCMNLETNETFPTSADNLTNAAMAKERDNLEQPKSKQKDKNQLSLF